MEDTSVLVTTKETDYLDEDKPIRAQNYVLLSFLSPEDVIVKKDLYILSKFICKFGDDMKVLLDGIKEKYPDTADMVNTIRDNHSYIFDNKEMNEQYTFYKSVNNDELEQSYHRDNNFVTSMRGIKVRGTFDTLEEAKTRSEFLKKIDTKFNIYIAQVGCWCPWSPNPECLDNQEYSETQLNTLMKEYKKNMDDKDVIFEERKNKVASNAAPVGSDSDKDNNIELDSLKSSIENVDVWSERQK